MRPTDTAKALTVRMEDLMMHLLPGGHKEGHHWCVGSTGGEPGSSLKVVTDGSLKGAWTDFATGEKGDLIGLWKAVKGITTEQANTEALQWLGIPDTGANTEVSTQIETKAPSKTWLSIQEKMRRGTVDDLAQLASLRKIPNTAGLELASNAGQLFFCDLWDDGFDYSAWIITDGSRRNAQARRMDGKNWAKDIKCKTIAGCEAKWPVGLHGLNGHDIAFVEGTPDLLAAWHLIWLKGLKDKISPVAMFGASMTIPDEALGFFENKTVFTFPHNDDAGHKAMEKWSSQMRKAKASSVVKYDIRVEGGKDLNDLVAMENADFEGIFVGPKKNTPKPLINFTYPSTDDPNILLGRDDYLGRGGGLLFVSHAGAGKSSWIMDACLMWGLGKPWIGINCSKKIRSLIIQAEDSDRYLGKIASSFAYKNNLSQTEINGLAENCFIVRVKGVSGQAFFDEVKRLTELHQPDLVVINPIYLYAEGDIARSEFAQPFLLGLDAINKEEKFAYILIHHTGKPQQKNNKGVRNEVEDWESAYMGFGSSYLANWPRCTALLEPVPNKQGSYVIKLGKGGLNAGIVKEVEQGAGVRLEPCTRIHIRHSTEKMAVGDNEKPVYYWELDDPTPDIVNPKGSGRKQKYDISTFTASFPTSFATALPAPQIHRAIAQYSGIPISSFKDLCQRAYEEKKLMRADKPGMGMVYWLKKDEPSQPLYRD